MKEIIKNSFVPKKECEIDMKESEILFYLSSQNKKRA